MFIMEDDIKALTEEKWHELVDRAFDSLPEPHRSAVANVAIVLEDDPTDYHREISKITNHQTLLGLYTGVPLPERHGRNDISPDVITLFKNPLLGMSHDEATLYENIRHTLWHEVAHYFGLDHDQIDTLDQ